MTVSIDDDNRIADIGHGEVEILIPFFIHIEAGEHIQLAVFRHGNNFMPGFVSNNLETDTELRFQQLQVVSGKANIIAIFINPLIRREIGVDAHPYLRMLFQPGLFSGAQNSGCRRPVNKLLQFALIQL